MALPLLLAHVGRLTFRSVSTLPRFPSAEIFNFGGIEFEDVRMTGPALMGARASGDVKPPFNQFPMLEVDGTPLAQSATLIRFAAKKAGLYPAGELESYIAESIVEQCNDIAGAMYGVFYGGVSEADRPAAIEKVMKEKMPNLLKGIANYLGGKTYFFSETEPCFADITMFVTMQTASFYGFDLVSVEPSLAKLHDAVKAHPKLQAYFAKREEVEAAEKTA
jgi:glutathione S-transferase